jgi:hypothetical protein
MRWGISKGYADEGNMPEIINDAKTRNGSWLVDHIVFCIIN